MSDIVQRLRNVKQAIGAEHGLIPVIAEHHPACMEAADEIERLQCELAQYKVDAERWRWARANLLHVGYQCGPYNSSRINLHPCFEDITSKYWDDVADAALRANANSTGAAASPDPVGSDLNIEEAQAVSPDFTDVEDLIRDLDSEPPEYFLDHDSGLCGETCDGQHA